MSFSTQDLIVFFCSFGVACFALNIYKLTQPAESWVVDIHSTTKILDALFKLRSGQQPQVFLVATSTQASVPVETGLLDTLQPNFWKLRALIVGIATS